MNKPETVMGPFITFGEAIGQSPAVLQKRADLLRDGLGKEISIISGSAILALLGGVYMTTNADQLALSLAGGTVSLLSLLTTNVAGVFALRDRGEIKLIKHALREIGNRNDTLPS